MSLSDRLKAVVKEYYKLPIEELGKYAIMVICPKCGAPTWTKLYSFEVPEEALTKVGVSGTGNCGACGANIEWNGEMVVKEEGLIWKECHPIQ